MVKLVEEEVKKTGKTVWTISELYSLLGAETKEERKLVREAVKVLREYAWIITIIPERKFRFLV